MKTLALVILLLPMLAHSQSTTTYYGFTIPVHNAFNWDVPINNNFWLLDADLNALSQSTSTASNVKSSTGTCILPYFPITLNSGNVVCQEPSNVTGNAATVTNGLYSTGSYSSPSWLTSVSSTIVSGLPSASVAYATNAGAAAAVPAAGVGAGTAGISITGNATADAPLWQTNITTQAAADRSAWQTNISTALTSGATSPTFSSGTFTATGSGQYSLTTSSGINVSAGIINTPELCFGANGCQTAPPGSGTIGGSGTSNYIPKFTAGTTLGNSPLIADPSGTSITLPSVSSMTIAGNLTVGGTMTGKLVANQNVVTGSRALNTVYHNTTGKAMFVAVTVNGGAVHGKASAYTDSNAAPTTTVGNYEYYSSNDSSLSGANQLFFIVLNGNYYEVTNDVGVSLTYWIEWN